ncbi:uroporphyrinogen-III C-methyltransferase [Cognatazoarcus halotolerans]|uniref:uroporphyrinogen-III C-methyltransferase n=1 Tax=Cognatazoarcus halotolerans TaxID=2686016 RepID=UPI001357EE80|nr:uroporphyrinogen-III C-methyltransferase [Cognatazoarcus halotolerans]MBX3679653.1 uroporphyrinogen-III C-methyltransferase [Rhodocyclaceae bacterium]
MSDQTPELNSPSEAGPSSISSTPAEPVRKGSRNNWIVPLLAIGLLIAFAAVAWQWVYSRERIGELRQELAQRLGDGDATARQARAEARLATESITELQVRLAKIEAQVSESQGQQAALEALYQSLSRNREEQVLAEVEQAVVLASQQLQLAGNTEAALTALQGAEARLGQLDAGPLVALRKALGNDIERLKMSSQVDISGLSVKLDLMIARIDDLGLAFTGEAQATPVERPEPNTSNRFVEMALQFGKELWVELRQLIRVERLDTADPALLSPAQSVFLRENLRLRLLSARLALLGRDSVSYKSDIGQSIKWLQRYFDLRSEPVQRTIEELGQLENVELASGRMPSLGDTLAVLRGLQLRGAPPAELPRTESSREVVPQGEAAQATPSASTAHKAPVREVAQHPAPAAPNESKAAQEPGQAPVHGEKPASGSAPATADKPAGH